MEQIITITISTGGAAFEVDKGAEVARVLRNLADKFEDGCEPSKTMDINGNAVGVVEYE
jgi:hypothetical protein